MVAHCVATLWWKPAIGRLITQLLYYFPLSDGISWANGCDTSNQISSCLYAALMQSDFWYISSQMWKRFGGQTARLPAGINTASNLEPPWGLLLIVQKYVSHCGGKKISVIFRRKMIVTSASAANHSYLWIESRDISAPALICSYDETKVVKRQEPFIQWKI